jgi:transketolase
VSDDQQARFRASGWHVQAVDGHDPEAVAAAIEQARRTDAPSLIACRTTIAYGAPTKAGTSGAHGSPLGAAEIAGAREKLGWSYPPFVVPEEIAAAWRAAGARAAEKAAAWRERHAAIPAPERAEFDRRMAGDLPAGLAEAVAAYKAGLVANPPKIATRQASGNMLDVVARAMPELIGGSADLTPSNNTRAKGQEVLEPGRYGGTYVHYGVREHGMAAAMNGLALHGGVVPYAGTFLVFTDYARPSIRLSALMGVRVVYVMTHDSIGLGEDGPTHQPVEHLAALRAMPNLNVFRPADAIETAECWELALAAAHTPSVIALSRQGVPALRRDADENRSRRGAYVLAEADGARAVTLIATGSEVSVAMDARARLAEEGIAAAVVSMPCWELFAAEDAGYRRAVLGTAPRVAVEAAIGFGWERWLGDAGAFVGMTGFGASAPAGDLYRHFGITAEAAVAAAKSLL